MFYGAVGGIQSNPTKVKCQDYGYPVFVDCCLPV